MHLDLLNKYQISFCCRNLANKDESSSVFKASKDGTFRLDRR